MKTSKQFVFLCAALIAVTALSSVANAQFGILWNLPPSTYFLGSANMDASPGDEICVSKSYGGNDWTLQIIDGQTTNTLWESDHWYTLYSELQFLDVNGDGSMELFFHAQTATTTVYCLVGYTGSGYAGGGIGIFPNTNTLAQNYPNPFNPATTISYEIQSPNSVLLEVYNLSGQLICTLVNETKPAGEYVVVWDGKDEEGSAVSSGTYFYQLRVGDYVSTKKSILLK